MTKLESDADDPDKPITIKLSLSIDNALIMSIADNGDGMTAQESVDAFRYFTTTAERAEPGYADGINNHGGKLRGLGVGLPLTRSLVNLYPGGRFFLQTMEPSSGTVAFVKFPVASGAPSDVNKSPCRFT